MQRKKGQMKLSFGMIFSIILIIVFLGAAFFGITKFLDFQKRAQIASFTNDFQNDIDDVWQSSQGSRQVTYTLPGTIEKICFREENAMYFFPIGSGQGFDPVTIRNLDIDSFLSTENPFCITTENKKISFILSKNYQDALVTLQR